VDNSCTMAAKVLYHRSGTDALNGVHLCSDSAYSELCLDRECRWFLVVK